MTLNRRDALLALITLPAGCAIQPLAPFATTALPVPDKPRPLRAPQAGQSWTYRQLNFFNSSVVDVIKETVTSVAPTLVVSRQAGSGAALPDERQAESGQLLRDPVWDFPMTFETAVPLWPTPLAAGAKTNADTRYRVDGGSVRYWIQVYCTARGWERVTVGAGTFDTLRVERLIRLDHPDVTRAETVRHDTMWLSPEVGRWVARDTSGEYLLAGDSKMRGPAEEDHFHWELTAWQ
jgi:hypothetical protein